MPPEPSPVECRYLARACLVVGMTLGAFSATLGTLTFCFWVG